MKKILKILIPAAVSLMLFTACSKESNYSFQEEPSEAIDLQTGFSASKEDVFQTVDETEQLLLQANLSNGEIIVKDKESGKEWRTNPEKKAEDPIASGTNKAAMFSQFILRYDTELGVSVDLSSYSGSVNKGGLESRLAAGKVVFKYTFEKEGFLVPVQYSLEGDRFVAEILTEGISETLVNKIGDIDFLPYFGAGSTEDDGYLLVPDGSGALIHFNNETTAKSYETMYFGFDNGCFNRLLEPKLAAKTFYENTQGLLLPIFGLKCNEDGFLAIITKGAGRATLNADISERTTSYNTINTSYGYRMTGRVMMTQKDMKQDNMNVAEKIVDTTNYQIKFLFLEHGKAEYKDMAGKYQQYLVKEEGLEKRTAEGDIPFYLDLYGYIIKTKSFLGIPKDTRIAMTTVQDAKNIVKRLNDSGISNINLKYNDWMKDGYFGKIQTGAKVDSTVGSAKEMKKLQQQLEENGGKLFLASELMNVYEMGNKVSKMSNTVTSVVGSPLMQFQFLISSASIDKRYNPWYLIKVLDLPEYMETLVTHMKDYGYNNLAMDSMGSLLYSELSKEGFSRSKAQLVIHDILKSAQQELGSIMLSGANSYAAVTAEHILDVPVSSSNYDIFDETVPFYEMVFHGYVNYAIGAVNLSSNPEEMFLKSLEFGGYPMYSWAAQNLEELADSRSNYLFSPDYSLWMDSAVEQYHEINGVLKETATMTITDYNKINSAMAATTYGDKITIVVNYKDTEEAYKSYKIPANGYLVIPAEH